MCYSLPENSRNNKFLFKDIVWSWYSCINMTSSRKLAYSNVKHSSIQEMVDLILLIIKKIQLFFPNQAKNLDRVRWACLAYKSRFWKLFCLKSVKNRSMKSRCKLILVCVEVSCLMVRSKSRKKVEWIRCRAGQSQQ